MGKRMFESVGAEDLARTVAQAKSAWEERWAAIAQPAEDFLLSFSADWGACGAVMGTMSCFDTVRVRSWSHDPPHHEVRFSCPPDTLQSLRVALRSMGARDFRCIRDKVPGKEGA